MKKIKEGLAVLAVSALLSAPSALAAPPAEGPVVGPLALHAVTGGSTSTGLFGLKVIGMEFAVSNLSLDSSIKAVMQDPVITYSDGSRQRLRGIYHGRAAQKVELDPNNTKIDFPLVVIDEGAPAGIATVELRGHVAWVSGGELKHSDWAPNNHAVSVATFLVLD